MYNLVLVKCTASILPLKCTTALISISFQLISQSNLKPVPAMFTGAQHLETKVNVVERIACRMDDVIVIAAN